MEMGFSTVASGLNYADADPRINSDQRYTGVTHSLFSTFRRALARAPLFYQNQIVIFLFKGNGILNKLNFQVANSRHGLLWR